MQFTRAAVITFIVSGILPLALAHAQSVKTLHNIDLLDLRADDSELVVEVAAPGPRTSGICALEIRADAFDRLAPISALFDRLRFSDIFGRKDPTASMEGELTIVIGLRGLDTSYMDGISISTRDGSSLRSVIQKTLGERPVVIIGRACSAR
jgi:hypothetical protein